jgi:hypothetical protein
LEHFGGAPRPLNYGYGDAFVAKLSPAVNALIYSTYLGGSSYDSAFGIAVDSSGNAYVTGYLADGHREFQVPIPDLSVIPAILRTPGGFQPSPPDRNCRCTSAHEAFI